MLKPEHSLAQTPTHIPEPSKGACQAQQELLMRPRQQPLQGGPYILGVTYQAIHPQMLLVPELFRLPLLGQRKVVSRTRLLYHLHLSRIHQSFQGVLPDRFEHQQTWLISTCVALLQQAFVQQGGDQIHGRTQEIRGCATDRFGRLKGTASHTDGQAPETPLLLGSEEIITPTDRIAQGLLPGGCILPSTRQHRKPTVEPPEQGLGGQQFAPRRCQLQGQWQSVQLDADLGDRRRVVLRKDKIGLHRLRTLNEKRDRPVVQQLLMRWQVQRIGQGERRHRKLVFPLHMQYCPAGHQDLEGGTGQQQFHQGGRGCEDLLKIIQQQQEVFVAQERFEGGEPRTFLDIAQAQRLGDGGHDQVRVAHSSKLHQAHPVRKRLAQIHRHLLSQLCLADAAGTGEGEESDLRPQQQRTDRVLLRFTSNQRREQNREILETHGRADGGFLAHHGCRGLLRLERIGRGLWQAGLSERLGEAEHVEKAERGIFGEGLEHHALHRQRDLHVLFAQQGGRCEQMLAQHLGRRALKGRLTTEPFIHHHRKGVLVALQTGNTANLLWGHVDQGATHLRRMQRARCGKQQGDAKIAEQDLLMLSQEQILRFEIAMDQALEKHEQ